MIELLLASIIILASYYLLIKGYFSRLLIAVFGSLGLFWFLANYVPSSLNTIYILNGASISWATLSPVIIIIGTLIISKVLK